MSKTISQLPAISGAPDGSAVLPMQHGGVTQKVSADQLVSAEATAREAADAALASSITAEATTRTDAVTAEAAAREDADDALAAAIAGLTPLPMPLFYAGNMTSGEVGKNIPVPGGTPDLYASSQVSQVAPRVCTFTRLAWDSTNADATTVLEVEIAGNPTGDITLTQARDSIAINVISNADGNGVTVRYKSGTAPNFINLTLS